MATLVLDTHKAITILRDAGFEEPKAEAVVEAFQEVNLENVATKEDISSLGEEISEFKADIFKLVVPFLIGQIVLFIALVEFLLNRPT